MAASSRPCAFLGIDAGTSACKGVVADGRGRLLATAWRPYPTRRRPGGEVTQDARDWLAAVEVVIAELTNGLDARVEALSITAPAHNVVLVDEAGEPLAPVIMWSDSRCAATAVELEERVGRLVLERAFVRLGPAWTLPQLVWLRRVHPELWPRIRLVLPAKDFLRWALTGEAATDPSDAAGTAMYDHAAGAWLDEALELAGLAGEALPPIRASERLGGRLLDGWAARTGLRAGTPVVVGATDTATELLAVDATTPGDTLVKIASTGTVVVVSGRPRPDPRVLTYPHAVEGRWYTVAATNTAATAYGWLRSALFEAPTVAPERLYEAMNRVAADVPAGAGGVMFLPFLEGERSPLWDPDIRAAFLGLSSGHTRAHLCRAVLEGVALSLRSCRDLLADLGLPMTRPTLGGGGVRSAVWREILAAALGEDAVLQEPQGPALGAAALAATGVGHSVRLEEGIAVERERVACRPDWARTYDGLADVYAQACATIVGVSHSLAAIARSEHATPLERRGSSLAPRSSPAR
jgi:xylulokinase